MTINFIIVIINHSLYIISNQEDNYRGVKILAVIRLSKGKEYDLVIKVCEQLVNEGYYIKWYIFGEGGEKSN